ncbi:MAG: HAD family hydrolase [Psychromonas sp.]|nr:HAD family hydrolase [Psychromonas sp.]
MYKIAISDLDGTLLNEHHKLSTTTKTSIEQWILNDRKFVIATGRSYIESKYIQSSINKPIYVISSNGGRIHNPDGYMIFRKDLPADIVNYICQYEFPQEIQITLFTDQHWYTNFIRLDQESNNIGSSFFHVVTNLKEFDVSNVIKITFWAKHNELIPYKKQLETKLVNRVKLTFSLDNCLELMPITVNKGVAAATVLKELGIDHKHAVAFGDGMNDVELLTLVGKPIVMKNAQPSLVSALPNSDMTNLCNKEHGVAEMLDKLRVL